MTANSFFGDYPDVPDKTVSPGDLMNEVNALTRERDALHAEVEQLLRAYEATHAAMVATGRERDILQDERDALRADYDRLKDWAEAIGRERDGYRAEAQALRAENERLKAEWDFALKHNIKLGVEIERLETTISEQMGH